MKKEVGYDDFELKSLEIKSVTEYKVEYFEEFKEEAGNYIEETAKTKKLYHNSQLMPLIKRLNNFLPTEEKGATTVKIRFWELGGEIEQIKITYSHTITGTATETRSSFKKTPLRILFKDNLEEVQTVLEEIKVNLYNVLICGEVYHSKTASASMEGDSIKFN